jgi:mannose-6-phosphate isomerase-like protein (cupin superfamily)
MLDIRKTEGEPVPEHNGTVLTHFFYEKEELRDATLGSYLEFVDIFNVAAGTALEPHFHNTHEFYFILSGSATMRVGNESRRVGPGELVHIPPNQVHNISADGDEDLRSFAFACSFQEVGESFTPAEFPG